MNGRFRVWALKRWTGFGLTRLRISGDTIPKRPFCESNKNSDKASEFEANLAHYQESYRQLDNLDFMSAAKIAFTDPPVKKKNKFGLDFHLVQLFFALMPSFAVYLVAQYARHEMRKMEAELEVKKKKADEEKAKEVALQEAAEREKARLSPEFIEVTTRLDKLEQAVNEIVVESKKPPGGELAEQPAEEPGKAASKAAEEKGQERPS